MLTIPSYIQTTVDIPNDLSCLDADSTMIKRVLVNLVQNGIQAMPKTGVLTIHAEQKNHMIIIDVEDTGEGIPKEVQSKLFTRLMTTKSKGQGFGLAVVKRMVEAMNATVTFESQQGKGNLKFTLKFPV